MLLWWWWWYRNFIFPKNRNILKQTVDIGMFRVIQKMPRQAKIIFSKMLLDVRVHLVPKYVM